MISSKLPTPDPLLLVWASSSPVVTVPFAFESRENIISQIIDLMCKVDWQDYELRKVWTVLENLSLLPAVGNGAGAA
jgi:hypothetical protein